MKKFIFGGIAVLAVTAVAAWNVSVNFGSQKSELSDISLANVEALADECGTGFHSTDPVWYVHHREDGTGYNCVRGASCIC